MWKALTSAAVNSNLNPNSTSICNLSSNLNLNLIATSTQPQPQLSLHRRSVPGRTTPRLATGVWAGSRAPALLALLALAAMAWRAARDSLLTPTFIERGGGQHPTGQGRGGLTCPAPLHDALLAQQLEAVDTKTDGNCGLDAFQKSAAALGAPRRKAWTDLWAAKDKIGHCRKVMVAWLKDHGQDEIWPGTTVQHMARAVSGVARYNDWLCLMSSAGHWVDTAALLGLAAAFGCDVCVIQPGQDPAILGSSLFGTNADFMVPMALANDRHFWAACEIADEPPVSYVDKGDFVRCSAAEEPRRKGIQPEFDDDDNFVEPATGWSENRAAAEMSLCEALLSWDPFSIPNAAVTAAVVNLAAVNGSGDDRTPKYREALGRQMALIQLQQELIAVEAMDKRLLYRRAEKRLQAALCGVMSAGRTRAEHVCASTRMAVFTAPSEIAKALEKNCWTHEKPHSCLDPFRAQPGAVKNWRVLWQSYPAHSRKELLLKMMRKADGGQLRLMGHAVCTEAFKLVTGIGASTLQEMRCAIANGQVSFHTQKELGNFMEIRCHAKAARYIDARSWLEHYAETHAEQSPTNGMYVLPCGRVKLYHLAYEADRLEEDLTHLDGKPADLVTFAQMWRTELPFIVISRDQGSFTKCGLCEYLKKLMDSSPRDRVGLGQTARLRLGDHYKFQSAQRLKKNALEERARRSDAQFWVLTQDKMDHSTTQLPTIWTQRATPLMKLGQRIVVAVNGAMVHGVKGAPPYHLTTMLEDAPHGAAMQSSSFLHLFHACALRQQSLPAEVAFGADNTCKETKNSTTYTWAIWLLAVTSGLPLRAASFIHLMVGHTHCPLVAASVTYLAYLGI